MIKMKLISTGGYHTADASRLPVTVMAEERRIPRADGSESILYMVDGDFIPSAASPSAFAGDVFPFHPGEVIPL